LTSGAELHPVFSRICPTVHRHDCGCGRNWELGLSRSKWRTLSADNPAARPQETACQISRIRRSCPQGQPAASRSVHPCVHHYPQEAELGSSQGRSCQAFEPDRGDRLHSGRGTQPAGALDRARARWPRQGSARCPLPDRARFARHPGRQGPSAGPQQVRCEEGEEVMPRKGPAPKRPIVVDPVFSSPLVTQLINKILLDGKRSTAERIVYGALEGTREKNGNDPVVNLKKALDNIRPSLEVRSRRVGGATYQVPVDVRPTRSTTLALRWLVGYARQRREKPMTERLMKEILDAGNGLGAAVKRREDTHKMAESNKAFAHYRWYSPSPQTGRRTSSATPSAGSRGSRANHRLRERHRGTSRAHRPEQGPQYRHHGPHRCREDNHERTHTLLPRRELQDGRDPRWRRHHRMEGSGEGTRQHEHARD